MVATELCQFSNRNTQTALTGTRANVSARAEVWIRSNRRLFILPGKVVEHGQRRPRTAAVLLEPMSKRRRGVPVRKTGQMSWANRLRGQGKVPRLCSSSLMAEVITVA